MRIRLSAAARRDMSGIWSYSADRWDGAQADRSIRMIADGFDRLAAGTAKSRSADDIRPGYFKLVVGSYDFRLIASRCGNRLRSGAAQAGDTNSGSDLPEFVSHVIFYRRRTSDVIEVVRIRHQQMDFDRHL